MCDSVNRESLQTEAIKVALEQNMLCNSDMKYMWHLMVELLILPNNVLPSFGRSILFHHTSINISESWLSIDYMLEPI